MLNTADLFITLWLLALIVTVVVFIFGIISYAWRLKKNIYFASLAAIRRQEEKAITMLSAAETQAAKIINEANLINRQTSAGITQTISAANANTQQALLKLSQQLTNDGSVQLRQYTDRFQQTWEQAISSLQQESAQGLDHARQAMQDATNKTLASLDEELNKYRRREEKRISQQLKKQLPELIKKITGKTIPLKVHEELIMDALETMFHENRPQ